MGVLDSKPRMKPQAKPYIRVTLTGKFDELCGFTGYFLVCYD